MKCKYPTDVCDLGEKDSVDAAKLLLDSERMSFTPMVGTSHVKFVSGENLGDDTESSLQD